MTDDHHFKDDPKIQYQFIIDKIISKKFCDGLSLLEGRQITTTPGSPLGGRRKGKQLAPLLIDKRSIPVPLPNHGNEGKREGRS